MNCPICKTGNVINEFLDTPEAGAELSCDSEECPSANYGIYCWLTDFVDSATAEAFYEEWACEYYCESN